MNTPRGLYGKRNPCFQFTQGTEIMNSLQISLLRLTFAAAALMGWQLCLAQSPQAKTKADPPPGKAFYAIVLDLDDNPVPNAEVYMHLFYPLRMVDRTFRTAANGRITLDSINLPPIVSRMDIFDIQKIGYSYKGSIGLPGMKSQPSLFLFGNDVSDTYRYHPDPDKPVVLRIRRKEPNPVYFPPIRGWSIHVRQLSDNDVFKQYFDTSTGNLSSKQPTEGRFFVFEVTNNETNKCWEVHVRSLFP